MDGAGGLGLAARVAMAAVPGRRKRKGPAVSEEYRRLHREGRVNGDGTGVDEEYLDEWERRDAELQAQGFPPSKLGPGVPAKIEEPNALGSALGMKARAWDDNGTEIPYEGSYPNGDMGEPGGDWEPGR